MADFLRVSEVLAAFPFPEEVCIDTIARRFGVSRPVASQARQLAMDYKAVSALAREYRLSRPEAEALYALRRTPSGSYGRRQSNIHRAAQRATA